MKLINYAGSARSQRSSRRTQNCAAMWNRGTTSGSPTAVAEDIENSNRQLRAELQLMHDRVSALTSLLYRQARADDTYRSRFAPQTVKMVITMNERNKNCTAGLMHFLESTTSTVSSLAFNQSSPGHTEAVDFDPSAAESPQEPSRQFPAYTDYAERNQPRARSASLSMLSGTGTGYTSSDFCTSVLTKTRTLALFFCR